MGVLLSRQHPLATNKEHRKGDNYKKRDIKEGQDGAQPVLSCLHSYVLHHRVTHTHISQHRVTHTHISQHIDTHVYVRKYMNTFSLIHVCVCERRDDKQLIYWQYIMQTATGQWIWAPCIYSSLHSETKAQSATHGPMHGGHAAMTHHTARCCVRWFGLLPAHMWVVPALGHAEDHKHARSHHAPDQHLQFASIFRLY